MAKKTNYVEYTCDRDQKREYLPENAVTVNKWYAVKRITADGVAQDYMFDAACYEKYQQLMATQDQAFNDFMANTTEEATK
jgi:hypothetical protein